jgi:hypothetical protein
MTEDEAKTKWCPFVRWTAWDIKEMDLEADSRCIKSNRDDIAHENVSDITCIGSDCMAWRWMYGDSEFPRKSSESGYCGLAGKR